MTEWIILALCIINLIVITAILLSTKKLNENSQDFRKLEDSIDKIEKQFVSLNSGFSIITKQFSDELQKNRAELSQNQKNMREEMGESLKTINSALEKMTKESYEHTLKLSNTLSSALNAIRENNAQQIERQNRIVSESISKMQESNEKKLDQMRETVDEKLNATLTTRLDSSFKTVSQQLENVYKSLGEMKELSTGVTDNVTSLNRVLTNVKARGTWAEVQLEGILDQTIPNMFDKNVATNPKSIDRVEFAVRIPSGENNEIIYLPIDSKFPMEDYIRLTEAADKADAEATVAARKMLENSVTAQAKSIAKYINIPKTTPFAIMYLATEGLYAEIASSKSGIQEKLHSNYNIMIAGPSTITALLNSLSMGFKAVAINEKASEVRNLLSAAKTQYDKFGNLLEKAKKKVDEAGKALGEAQDRNRIINKKLKNIEAIDYTDSNQILGIESSDFTDISELTRADEDE
ncbi:MAG: DNA recombination protein RmuC [Clostridia bacterium]|nr:DNA recombination protein RmuC [Clostridia bacterium]